jgi:hypothetical protein
MLSKTVRGYTVERSDFIDFLAGVLSFAMTEKLLADQLDLSRLGS